MTAKTGNMAMVYGTVAILSVLLLVVYLLWEKKKEKRFVALFACVATVNCGYFLQAARGANLGQKRENRPAGRFFYCFFFYFFEIYL